MLKRFLHPDIAADRGGRNGPYFPLCEGMAHVAWKFFTCQSGRAFPDKSMYNRVDKRPVGLLERKKPFPSPAQSIPRPSQRATVSTTTLPKGGLEPQTSSV